MIQKVPAAEDAWNTGDPARLPAAYTPMSRWRNRDEFFSGREAIAEFLERKWAREARLSADQRAVGRSTEDRIAVRFVYESHDADRQWWRSHGNEMWLFDEGGCMAERHASINDVRIAESERLFRCFTALPAGRLSAFGFTVTLGGGFTGGFRGLYGALR